MGHDLSHESEKYLRGGLLVQLTDFRIQFAGFVHELHLAEQ